MLPQPQLLEDLVAECRQDHVGLWEIVNAVRDELEPCDEAELKRRTQELLGQLLTERGMRVGQPAGDGRGFVAWNASRDEAVRRIMSEWAALGKDPDIGDIAWFTCDEV
jgi:hypothetical protein